MTATARAAVFTGPGQPLEIRTYREPALEAGEVLVRITASTLCGSDLHTYQGRRAVAVPTVLGHEMLGRIERFGPGEPPRDQTGRVLQIGDRVTWAVVASCGECFYCRRNLTQKCERSLKYGHELIRPGQEFTGGLADICILRAGTAIYVVPDELPDEVACPANCATATVAAVLAATNGGVRGGAVVVLGAGMLGLTACAMAREAGAAEVVCCDVSAARLARGKTFGATRTATPEALANDVKSITSGRGVDAVLELTGSSDATTTALPLLRMGGTMVLAGAVFPTPAIALLPEQVVRRQLAIRGVHNYQSRDLRTALEFLRDHRHYPFASLVSDWVPLDDADRAFRLAHESGAFRIGVRPG